MLKNILKFKQHDIRKNLSNNIDYAFEIQRLKKLKKAVILLMSINLVIFKI